MSESEVDEEVADTGGSSELTMVTEVWIEPQHGFVSNGTPERLHYDGCTFSQWPDRVSFLHPVQLSVVGFKVV